MSKARILVVDDEANTLFVLRDLLAEEYEVFVAENGDAGLAVFAREELDLVIADQRMPGMTGVDMLTRMRSVNPDCLRIVLSAFADFDAVVDAVNHGQIYQFVLKPWNPEEMFVTIRHALEHQEAQRVRERLIGELQEKNASLELATRELLSAQEALVKSEKLAAVGKLAGNLVHEISNHIQGVRVYGGGLREKYAGDAELKRYLESVQKMSELVHSMLESYRFYLHGEEIPFNFKRHDLLGIIEEVITLSRMATYGRGRSISCPTGSPAHLHTDDEKLSQVLVNLVKNACEAAGKGGTVLIDYEVEAEVARIRVSDDGPGVAPELLTQIWEPFFTTRGKSGLGLGLDICKSFVEGLGGSIECESAPEEGAVFTITFRRSD